MKPRSLTVRVCRFGSLRAFVGGHRVADTCAAHIMARTLSEKYQLSYLPTLTALHELTQAGDVWRTKINPA